MPANYVLIEKISVGAAGASSVTFSGIPQTGYTDLVIKMSARSNRNDGSDWVRIDVNEVNSNYTDRKLLGDGTSASSQTNAGTIGFTIDASSSTASTFANSEIYIPNYASANYKSFSIDTVSENNATGAYQVIVAGLWSSTSAITSLKLVPNYGTGFLQYSTFYLYGVAALGTTPAIVPYATGGDTIMTDGTYWYHAFLSSGTFTPTKALSCDVVVVAGGGGGGKSVGGGGGAGGLFYAASSSVASGTGYTVTIGAGGATSAGGSGQGFNGSNSVFGALTAAVGGGGGGGDLTAQYSGLTGGSGGGAGGGVVGSAGSATSGQGFAGGTNVAGGTGAGGGGGGAGAVGANGASNAPGAGGAGVNTYSAWLSATGTGVSGYVAGGGAGGANNGQIASGGAGGGGTSANGAGGAATANTGGGGAGGAGGGAAGGQGGSGLVLVRYLV
jgi:hypothetical protein